jgi:hypothetical protein
LKEVEVGKILVPLAGLLAIVAPVNAQVRTVVPEKVGVNRAALEIVLLQEVLKAGRPKLGGQLKVGGNNKLLKLELLLLIFSTTIISSLLKRLTKKETILYCKL